MRVRGRFWLENVLAGVAFVALALTLSFPGWIEAVFGVDPDRGSGALEWMIVAIFLCVALLFSGLAHREYRRAVIAAD